MNEPPNNDTAKIVAISCSHSPFSSVEAQARLLKLLSDEADSITHFVHCGDLLEAAAASVHPGEHDHTLADEFRHASAYLEAIRSVLPESVRFYWLWGNHDDNIFRREKDSGIEITHHSVTRETACSFPHPNRPINSQDIRFCY